MRLKIAEGEGVKLSLVDTFLRNFSYPPFIVYLQFSFPQHCKPPHNVHGFCSQLGVLLQPIELRHHYSSIQCRFELGLQTRKIFAHYYKRINEMKWECYCTKVIYFILSIFAYYFSQTNGGWVGSATVMFVWEGGWVGQFLTEHCLIGINHMQKWTAPYTTAVLYVLILIMKFMMRNNTKIKIAPSVDKGCILIRILVTCLTLSRTKKDMRAIWRLRPWHAYHWWRDLFMCDTVHIRRCNVKSHWKAQGRNSTPE